MSMIERLARNSNAPKTLKAINSAIICGTPIIIGYTDRNLRYGEIAENYLHIGGKSYYLNVGYADTAIVAEELRDHAEKLGLKAPKIKICKVADQVGNTGCTWWRENSHLNAFKCEDFYDTSRLGIL